MGPLVRRFHQIDHVIAAVPARNEEQRIAASIRCIVAAAQAVGQHIATTVSVATDSCTDGTAEVLAAMADSRSDIRVVSGSWSSAGGARRAAVENGLRFVGSGAPRTLQRTWIATTDADSCVPVDWLTSQLRFAESGYDAVAGTVQLNDDEDCTFELRNLFARNYAVDVPGGRHTHVHGANMGFRASAYIDAGGFPAVQTSEDRILWNELVRLKYRVVSPVDLKVATSGRLKGRVVGGFADAMANAWT
jgi:cellulose synthase/poly-beta-1,6-N-acetylglucosamine synthase-like glycosyltransferase